MNISILIDDAGPTVLVESDTVRLRSLPLFNEQVAHNLSSLVKRVGLHVYRNWVDMNRTRVSDHLFTTFARERAIREATK